jgi:citrate synthase
MNKDTFKTISSAVRRGVWIRSKDTKNAISCETHEEFWVCARLENGKKIWGINHAIISARPPRQRIAKALDEAAYYRRLSVKNKPLRARYLDIARNCVLEARALHTAFNHLPA